MNELGIKDLGLSCALLERGHPILRFEKTNNNKKDTQFVFEDTQALQDDYIAYINGSLMVSASRFMDAMRTLKSCIYTS